MTSWDYADWDLQKIPQEVSRASAESQITQNKEQRLQVIASKLERGCSKLGYELET